MSHLFFLEVKVPKKISKNQPVIFEQNLLKNNKLFFWNCRKIFYNVFGRENSTLLFMLILDDFKYARAYKGTVLTRVKGRCILTDLHFFSLDEKLFATSKFSDKTSLNKFLLYKSSFEKTL